MRIEMAKLKAAVPFLLYLTGAGAAAAFFHLRTPNLVDPDDLYHFRHASLYAARGPLLSGFPWLLALRLVFLIRGAAWEVAAAAFGVAFFHLSLAWIVVVVAAAVLLAQLASERRCEWRKGLAALAGALAGWFLRPEALGAARL